MNTRTISTTKAIGLFVLTALFLCFEMGVQVSPSVMTQYLMRDLAITTVGLGFMSSFYFYTYTLMQIPAGLLFDRFQVRWVVVIPLIVCGLGTFVFGQAVNIGWGSLGRLLMGAGSAFAFIAVLVVASDLFKKEHFALMAGLTQMLAACGAMLGEGPLLPLIKHFEWRGTMMILTVVALILAALIWLFVRYERCDQVKSCEKNQPTKIMESLGSIMGNRQTWWIALYACLLWAPMAAFASLWGVPLLEHSFQMNKTLATELVMIMWVGIAMGSPLVGWLSDFIKSRTLPLAMTGVIGCISMLLVVLRVVEQPYTIAICLFFAGAACSGQVLSFAVVNDNNPSHTKAAAIGFNNMAVVIAGVIFQPLLGIIIKDQSIGSYQFAGFVIVACYAVGAIIAWRFIRSKHYN
jgi:predicted MFS family arabinose efflux permease